MSEEYEALQNRRVQEASRCHPIWAYEKWGKENHLQYNTAHQTSAGTTPFQALYGREPPTVIRYILGSSADDIVERYMLRRDEVLEVLKVNLSKAQQRMKRLADKSRTDDHFDIGDWVYIKLKPYRQSSVRLQKDHKLGRKYFGPFKVIKRVGNVAYKLELPDSALIHPVFHISMLKRCIGKPDQQITPLLLTDSAADNVTNLEDKVLVSEGGNVVNERDPAEVDDTQAQEGELGRGRRIKMPNTRLADYDWNQG